MMTKITLSVPEQVVIQMKEVAKKRKTSISKMFTTYAQFLARDIEDKENKNYMDKMFPVPSWVKDLPKLSLTDEEIKQAKEEHFAKKYSL